jgi:hypothetical protein
MYNIKVVKTVVFPSHPAILLSHDINCINFVWWHHPTPQIPPSGLHLIWQHPTQSSHAHTRSLHLFFSTDKLSLATINIIIWQHISHCFLVTYIAVNRNAPIADQVFHSDCSTKEVYEEGVREVALSVVSGINCEHRPFNEHISICEMTKRFPWIRAFFSDSKYFCIWTNE